MGFDGKVAIVLGGIKGIGKAIGLDLLKRGVRVATTWFDWEESLDQMESDFTKTKTDYMVEKINLLETDKIFVLIERVVDRFKRLDILINNIERGGWPVVHGKYVEDQWDMEIATTLRAKQWFLEHSIPYLKASGNGAVINISSISGIVGRSGATSLLFNEGYSAANRGISLLTETWARIGAPEVRINEIMLGIFESRHGPMTKGWVMLGEKEKRDIIDRTLMGRIGRVEDVVKAVRFLLEDAPFMTGSVIRLDGGYVIGGDKTSPIP